MKDFKNTKQGIYRQIPLVDMLHPDYVQDMAEDHKKGSVDIVLVIKGEIYAIRVQGDGHYGELKPKKDALQKMWLKKSGVNVIDIWKHECSELFRKDKLTPKSVIEIAQSFQYQTNDIVISKQAQKKALRAGSKKAEEYYLAEAKKQDANSVKVYKEAGVQIKEMSSSEFKAWQDLAKKTSYKQFVADYPDGQRFLDLALAVD